MSNKIEASMLLVNASWKGHNSFKMIPITSQCPYTECLYDPASKIFVIVGKDKKTGLHMLPKLDEMGDPQVLKTALRPNGKNIKEQRVTLETWQEYYIEDLNDAKDIIKMFAINAGDFDYEKFIDAKIEIKEKSSLIS